MQVNPYPFKSAEWYRWTHEEAQAMHEVFLAWVEPRLSEIKSVRELGCGSHRFYSRWFTRKGISYCGVEHDSNVCAGREPFIGPLESVCCEDAETGICNYVASMGIGPPPFADLVFSRATIDHVSDPDEFLRRAVAKARKYVYIMTYRPPLVNTGDHKIEKGGDGYCYNDLSIERLHQVIDEFPVKARQLKSIPTGRPKPEIQTELHIIVEV